MNVYLFCVDAIWVLTCRKDSDYESPSCFQPRRTSKASCKFNCYAIANFFTKRFASLCKYFRGEHHLEEIMYHENIRRSALLQLIDKFRDILVKVEHEDPAVSMYFRRME